MRTARSMTRFALKLTIAERRTRIGRHGMLAIEDGQYSRLSDMTQQAGIGSLWAIRDLRPFFWRRLR